MVTHSTTRAICVNNAVSCFCLFHRRVCDGSRSRIGKLRWVLEPERISGRRCHSFLAAVAVLTELAGHCDKRTKVADHVGTMATFICPTLHLTFLATDEWEEV
jgi:hypothetical protein